MTTSAPDDQLTPEPRLAPHPAVDHARPDWEFVMRHPAHFIAFGGGAGLSPVAPGTMGDTGCISFIWAGQSIPGFG